MKPIVFFIHGLNTFGDDQFHAGPLTFGPMNQFWKPALEAIGFEFHSLTEMGFGPIDEQVDRAVKQIERVIKNEKDRDVHFLGHSMGGLVARGAAAKLRAEHADQARVRSIITIGTPHNGTLAAEGALDLQKTAPAFYKFLSLFGYDIEKRREPISHLKLDRIKDFTNRYPSVESGFSLVGAASFAQIAWPFRVIHRHLHTPGTPEPSDGLVWADNQRWATVAGEFELDHFGELGAHVHVNPFARRRAQREFARAVQTVQDIIRTNSI